MRVGSHSVSTSAGCVCKTARRLLSDCSTAGEATDVESNLSRVILLRIGKQEFGVADQDSDLLITEAQTKKSERSQLLLPAPLLAYHAMPPASLSFSFLIFYLSSGVVVLHAHSFLFLSSLQHNSVNAVWVLHLNVRGVWQ